MAVETRLFINNQVNSSLPTAQSICIKYQLTLGQYVSSSRGKTFCVTNPTTDRILTDQIHAATSEDVDKAVVAARAAFNEWKDVPSAERAAMMNKFADLVSQEGHAKNILELESTSMGMPVALASRMVGILADGFRYYAGMIDKIPGELKMVTYEPIGVVAGISAWNGIPLSLSWKVARTFLISKTLRNLY
jgi:acyl-CoA reductase-like NAD-dependent aldehyde dehydrogenase